MSDDNYGTQYGPSTPGALNLVSGQTYGGSRSPRPASRPRTPRSSARPTPRASAPTTPTLDPAYDDCSNSVHPPGRDDRQEHRRPAQREERDLGLVPGRLRADRRGHRDAPRRSAARRTPTSAARPWRTTAPTTTRSSSTRRPRTRTTSPPASEAEIGHNGAANHQYDLSLSTRRSRTATCPRVSLREAGRVPGRPRRLLRPDSTSSGLRLTWSTRSSSPSTGTAPRS